MQPRYLFLSLVFLVAGCDGNDSSPLSEPVNDNQDVSSLASTPSDAGSQPQGSDAGVAPDLGEGSADTGGLDGGPSSDVPDPTDPTDPNATCLGP